jgi:hypothetical protein
MAQLQYSGISARQYLELEERAEYNLWELKVYRTMKDLLVLHAAVAAIPLEIIYQNIPLTLINNR